MMNPLVYDCPQNKNTWDLEDQFLFGSSILVNPIINYKSRNRKLYLTKGYGYNFGTNEKISGGRNLDVSALLNQMSLFLKVGSIIPIGSKVQYAMQAVDEPLKVFIYPGGDESFILYEDETYHYEQGAYSEILVNWHD